MATRKKRAPASSERPLLSSLSSDWYWEQDAEFRFTRIEVQAGTAGEEDLARRSLGRPVWETGIQVEGGWDAHRAALEARAPYHELLMWRDFPDGSRRYISVSGEPVLDAEGRFTGYRGVGRDITRLKRGEQLLRLQHTVTRVLAEATRSEEGAAAALRAVCETEGWDCGELWRSDEAGTAMRRSAIWVQPGQEAAQRYTELSGNFEFRPGQGLVGKVWESGGSLWIEDVTRDERAVRGELAERTGLAAAFLCPVPSGNRVIAVMGFVCRRIRAPDDALLQAMMALSTQLGLFLRRADAEERLRQSEESFRHTFELAGVGIAHIGHDRRFLRLNRRFCEILGYAEGELVGRTGRDLSHAEDRDHMNAQRPRLYSGEIDAVRGEKRYVRKDGSVVWVAYTLALERDASGAPQYEIAVYDDISARKAMEDALRKSEARFRSLTELSSDFFWETDAQHRFTSIVHGPGYSQQIDRIIGKTAWEIPYTRPEDAAWQAFRATMDAQKPFREFEFGRPWQNDAVRYFSVSGQPHFADDGTFLGYRGVGRDITEIVLARERIAALAYHDALTGLDNRTSLLPALEKSVERSRRRGTRLAGLFLDLDGFKQINDRHGHDAGDRLLVQVAQRLRRGLRASDPVARLGGDEFFVVLEDLSTAAPAERVANKLLAAVLLPYDLGGGTRAEISASIGISFYPDDAGDAATLIKHADMAMYAAKQAGKNAYRVFTDGPAANDVRPAEQQPARPA
jgi:diguanylate cyclase (GGDEF)-like protein/PAS domain S-box-containing protein